MTRVHAQYVGSVTDETAIHDIFRAPTGPVGQDIEQRAQRVLISARALTPKHTGRLVSTLRIEAGDAALGPYRDIAIGYPGRTDYLGYVIYGTEPHVIRPTRAKALRFLSGGKIVFSRVVHHPGTKANDFMIRALNSAQ